MKIFKMVMNRNQCMTIMCTQNHILLCLKPTKFTVVQHNARRPNVLLRVQFCGQFFEYIMVMSIHSKLALQVRNSFT